MNQDIISNFLAQGSAQKCLQCAIIGLPNAGKSTFMNALVGHKVSIVTHKANTTKSIISGVITQGETQIVFWDTPGLIRKKHRYEDKALNRSIINQVGIVDRVIYIIDALSFDNTKADGQQYIFSLLQKYCSNAVATDDDVDADLSQQIALTIIFNKIDKLKDKKKLLIYTDYVNQCLGKGVDISFFYISAIKGDGIADIKQHLNDNAKDQPWITHDDEIISLENMQLLLAEITREKVMLNLHQEIPYLASVITESWQKPRQDGDDKHLIHQKIVLARDSHKQLAIGKNGTTIKRIGTQARIDIEKMLGEEVNLKLLVTVA
jgi:GTP-binding protein Era